MQPDQIFPQRRVRRKRRLVLEIVGVVVVLAVVAAVLLTRGGGEREDLGSQPDVARQLLAMERADQAARNQAIHAGAKAGASTQDSDAITTVDKRNTTRLKAIVERYGWPGKSLVGERASQSAWLLAQHADLDIAFQKRALVLMKAMPSGEVDPKNIAYLTDRVLVAERKEQVYGTQLECRNGELVPRTPIANASRVDALRERVGMDKLSTYKKSFMDVYGECPKA